MDYGRLVVDYTIVSSGISRFYLSLDIISRSGHLNQDCCTVETDEHVGRAGGEEDLSRDGEMLLVDNRSQLHFQMSSAD